MKKGFIESKYFMVLLHFLIWSTFFTLQLLSFQDPLKQPPELIKKFNPNFLLYRFIFNFILMIIIYYLNSLILIPRLLFRNKVWKFILSLVIVLIFTYILEFVVSNYMFQSHEFRGNRPPITFFISIFVIAVSTSIKLAQKWIENESKQKEMIHEKLNSELSVLKAQVNPHFLFNTLNGIYSLANAKSDKTAPAVVKLSQLMRYMLDESKQEFVPLTNELDYINTFIDLQKLRLFENVKIEYNIKGDVEGIKIQPLLLIPFIENAFKHGTDSSSECLIKIDLSINSGSIQLIVSNNIFKSRKEKNSGFGLNNIRRRLDLEYPEKYLLTTDIVDNRFVVKLFINLV